MLLHEARDYEYAEKKSGDENDASSFMHHLVQKVFPQDRKPANQTKATPNKAASTCSILEYLLQRFFEDIN